MLLAGGGLLRRCWPLFPLSSIPMPSSDLKKDSSLVMMPQRRCEFATGGWLFQRLFALSPENNTGATGFVIGLPSGASGFTLMRSQMTSELGIASQEFKIEREEKRRREDSWNEGAFITTCHFYRCQFKRQIFLLRSAEIMLLSRGGLAISPQLLRRDQK